MEGEKKQVKLFREKSLETIESPESLNDYLRVTSPGVWLILAAVIAVLVGGILWSILGRINTTAQFAVSAGDGKCLCIVPYESLRSVMERGSVTIEGKEYTLNLDADVETMIVSDETNPFIRIAGGLNVGDLAVEIPVNAELPDGVYLGDVVTESLRPISLLLQ